MSGTNSCGNRRLVHIVTAVSVTFKFIGFNDFDFSLSSTNSCGDRRLVHIVSAVSVTFRFIGFHDFGARESHSFHRFALLDMNRNSEM